MSDPFADILAGFDAAEKQMQLQRSVINESQRFIELLDRLGVPAHRQLEDGQIILVIDLALDQPAPQKQLPAPTPQQPAPKQNGKMVWTDDVVKELLDLRDAGKTCEHIAAHFGCSEKAISMKLYKLSKKPAPKPKPAPPLPPRPQPVAVTEQAPPFTDQPADAKARAVAMRLKSIGYPAPFTPDIDLQLITELTTGRKLGEIALDLGIDADLLRRRFDALVPDKSIEQQTAVIRALRDKAA